jgi:hydrogenase expression/formation protein HypE
VENVKSLPVGKLSWTFLDDLLREHRCSDPDVIVGPGIGEDAAVVDLGNICLVASSDPITFATDAIGHYAVQINANDLATMGATPRWFLATLLLPEAKTTEEQVRDLFQQICDACGKIEISLIGGHSEVTAGLDRPIVVGTMLGQVDRDQLVTSSGARVGDVLILTKGIAIEATALIARERYDVLRIKYSNTLLERCKNLLYDPGIGVLPDARTATGSARVHAMHDPTEGGLATGLWELAQASRVGLQVDREAIVVLPETACLCETFGLDPLGLIASGALLVVVDPRDVRKVLGALAGAGIAAQDIGRVTEGHEVLWKDGSRVPRFERDEVARLFEEEEK